MKKSVAILCGGGPAPGINTVVATISKRFLEDGFRVIGVNEGYKTLFNGEHNTIDIDFNFADRIFNRGGSALQMSRYKPKDEEFSTDFFSKNNVKLLVTIGGDDTASTANRLTNFLKKNSIEIQNIHVPKTIDNDLPLPENIPTFGFQTAKNEASRISSTVYEDARTSGNWFTIVTMGREAGHLAFGIGTSIHAPMIIIPEMFNGKDLTFDKILKLMVSAIVKRKLEGVPYGAILISEGVFHFMSEEEIINSGINFTYDDHGHPELGNVSKAHIFNTLLQKELKSLGMDTKCRPVELGYEIRCCDPISFDLKYCTALGNGVKILFDRGESGCIVVSYPNGKIAPLYLKDIADENGKIKPRLVDIESEEYKIIEDRLTYIKESDYEAAKKFVENPESYNLKNILK
ncbi:MAG: 6-phosphofructokinase [Candidatus Cloacimonadota bacterium]|nr:MAG: 6-phosphofructokinase [Candidatus Cloacimonadota bacterium]PIE77952.1 MAG: 6-phosphofructokinase [Candidatus Delongbacteria bacterium]